MNLWFFNREGILDNYQCTKLPVSIGRGDGCDFQIPESTVSGRHATLSKLNDTPIITDLQSANGTFINNTRIHRQTLVQGDTIELGKFKCWFGTFKPGYLPNFISMDNTEKPLKIFQQKPVSKGMNNNSSGQDKTIQNLKKNIEKNFTMMFDNLLVRILPWPEKFDLTFKTDCIIRQCLISGKPLVQIFKEKKELNQNIGLPFSTVKKQFLKKGDFIKGIRCLKIAFPVNTSHIQVVFYMECFAPKMISSKLFQMLEQFSGDIKRFKPVSETLSKNWQKKPSSAKHDRKCLPFPE